MDHHESIKIVNHKRDVIITSDSGVYPKELKNVISTCRGVIEYAAIGIEDEQQGKSTKVFVVKDDTTLTAADDGAFCKQQLTRYKCPKYVEFRDALTKTNVRKILRRDLRSKTKP